MQDKIWLRSSVLIAAPLALCAAMAQPPAEDFSAVEITAHQVAGNLYYLEGRGGNIGLSVGPDGIIMIDDQFAPLTEKIVAAIRGISPADIRFLINTHVHGDHTGGNENFGEMGVTILAHDNVRVRLTQGIRGGPPAPAIALPVITFSDAVTLYLNGEEVHAFPVPPAHTDGDSFIHFRGSDVLHLGDVFRSTGYPYIDVENGGTLEGLLQALEIAIDLAGPDTKIIPGHGGLATRGDVEAFRDLVLEVERRVTRLVEQGMTLEQVIGARPTADLDAQYGSPDRFLPGVYAGVKQGT
jgi:glyoxylase-like metal-dependent hydrolase (beta-lactamase superfamily II)